MNRCVEFSIEEVPDTVFMMYRDGDFVQNPEKEKKELIYVAPIYDCIDNVKEIQAMMQEYNRILFFHEEEIEKINDRKESLFQYHPVDLQPIGELLDQLHAQIKSSVQEKKVVVIEPKAINLSETVARKAADSVYRFYVFKNALIKNEIRRQINGTWELDEDSFLDDDLEGISLAVSET